jgi:hypothetical protein
MSCLLSLSFRFLLVTAVMLEGLCKIGWEKRLGADGEKVCGGTNARGLWLEAVVGGCGWGVGVRGFFTIGRFECVYLYCVA